MKKLLLMFIGIIMILGSLSADEVIIKVPLDIDGLPNNGNIITSYGTSTKIEYIVLKVIMLGCNDERSFFESLPLPSGGIHETITIRKKFPMECGDENPQVTVHLSFSESSQDLGSVMQRASTGDSSNIYPARNMSSGESSLKSLIVTNVDAVRGHLHKVN